jgi:hypothetical protein
MSVFRSRKENVVLHLRSVLRMSIRGIGKRMETTRKRIAEIPVNAVKMTFKKGENEL